MVKDRERKVIGGKVIEAEAEVIEGIVNRNYFRNINNCLDIRCINQINRWPKNRILIKNLQFSSNF